MTTVKCTEFVKRQTKESPFSYLATPRGGTTDEWAWRALEVHVEECVEEPAKLDATVKPGYREGVLIISMPYGTFDGYRFYSGVVSVTPQTQLSARFSARSQNESPFLEVLAHNEKTPATHVDIILYSRDLLLAEGEKVPEGVDYEIVSINARAQEAPEPMTPMAMARNFLALPGGTKAEYTAQQFAEAIVYWSSHAMFGGSVPEES